jgi:predicted TIM-barrel fold metal-dependent hydrolase
MLVLKNKRDNKTYSFFTVDFHHHLGVDEGGYESTPTGSNGTYDACKKILNGDGVEKGLKEYLSEDPDEFVFSIPENGKLAQYHPVMKYFSDADNKLSAAYQFEQTLSIDQIVVFPMHDKLRLETGIEYEACNNLIQKWSELYPHSLRIVGFGRLNPNQYPANLKELRNLVNIKGLRGLKMHPSSEDFMIDSVNIKSIVTECAKLNIPVIFHTTYGSEVRKLEKMVNDIIVDLFNTNQEKYLSGLKVIPGHFSYMDDSAIKVLSHPCIYGEFSGLSNPMEYLRKLRALINIKNFFDQTVPELNSKNPRITKEKLIELFGSRLAYTKWSSKIMLGTDHPFIPFDRTAKALKSLFHVDNFVTVGDIERILGANAVRLIKPKFFLTNNDDEFKKHPGKEFVKHCISHKKNIFFDPLVIQSPLHQIRMWDAIVSVRDEKGGFTGLCSLRKYSTDADKKNENEIRNLSSISEISDLLLVDSAGNITREFKDSSNVLNTFFYRTSKGMLEDATKSLNMENMLVKGK